MTDVPDPLSRPADLPADPITQAAPPTHAPQLAAWSQGAARNPAEEARVASAAAAWRTTREQMRQMLPAISAQMPETNTWRDLREQFPVSWANLGNADFVGLVHDDIGNLQLTEGTWDWFRRSWSAAAGASRMGTIGRNALLEGRALTPQEQREVALLQVRAGEHAKRDTGPLSAAVEIARSMWEPLAAGAAAGTVAGAVAGPSAPLAAPIAAGAAAFTASLDLEAGNLYLTLVNDQGYTPAEARSIALGYGAAIAAVDLIGTGVAGKALSGTAKALLPRQLLPKTIARGLTAETRKAALVSAGKAYLAGLGVEPGTEWVQEVIGMMGEEAARRAYHPERASTFDWGQANDVFVHTLKGMVVLGGLGGAVHLSAGMRKAADAQNVVRGFQRFNEAQAQSKLGQRSPDDAAKFAQDNADRAERPTVYMRAQRVEETLAAIEEEQRRQRGEASARDSLEALSPGFTERLRAAVETGGNVEVPSGVFFAKIAPTETGRALMQHATTEEDGYTPAEAEQVVAQREALMAEADRLIAEEGAKLSERAQQAAAVKKEVRDQLIAAGRNPDEADVGAQMARDFVTVNAAREGVSITDYWKANGFSVQKIGAVSGPLQSQIESPAFKEWFGDSKVVDEKGAPLVVHHGGAAVDVFDTTRGGDGTTQLGPGAYFGGLGVAEDWAAARGGDGRRVTSVYLALRQPWDERTPGSGGKPFSAEREAAVVRELKALGLTDRDLAGIDHPDHGMFVYLTKQLAKLTGARSSWDAAPMLNAALRRAGVDGIVAAFDYNGGGYQYVAFEPSQIKSVNNQGTFDPNDPNILRSDRTSTVRGGFDPERDPITRMQRILLTPDVDASTFLHELAHWNLEQVIRLAETSESAAADAKVLLDWFGFQGTAAEWAAAPDDVRIPHHEQFAYNFEVWLSEGRAPSAALAGVFSKVAAWMRRVYDSIVTELNAVYRRRFGRDLPGLTRDVRQVFGRMMASTAEVDRARAADAYVPMFQTLEEWTATGGDPAEWAAYRAQAEADEREAIDQLTEARMREVGFLRKQIDEFNRRRSADIAATRREVTRAVELEVAAMPVMRARRWLRSGEYVNPDGIAAREDRDLNHKLDAEKVRAIWPRRVGQQDDTEQFRPYMVEKGGRSPDQVAELFDYESGRQLLDDLAKTPLHDEVVEDLVDQRMLVDHSDLVDPERRDAELRAALHNKVRQRIVAAELRHLEKSEAAVPVMLAAAKEAARRLLSTRVVGEVKPRTYALAASRARADARAALKAGDLSAARDAKRREMLNDALVVEAKALRDQVVRTVQVVRRMMRDDKRLATTRDVAVVRVGRAIAAAFGLAPPDGVPARKHLEPIQKNDEALYAELLPTLDDALAIAEGAPPGTGPLYQRLTAERFLDLATTLRSIWHRSRQEKQVQLGDQKVAAETARKLAVQTLEDNVPKAAAPTGSPTRWERIMGGARDYFARLTRVQHFFRKIDGGEPGVFTAIFRRVKEAGDLYRRDLRLVTKEIEQSLRSLDLGPRRRIVATELLNEDGRPYVFGQGTKHGKAELLGMLLHTGNASNRSKLTGGYGWSDAALTQFIDRMIAEGELTKADFDWLQETWDRNERWKGPLQRAHYALYGYWFEEIEATPVVNALGRWRGGYVPATTDPDLVSDAKLTEQEQADELRAALPVVPRGMTKSRVAAYQRKLSFDIASQSYSLSKVLRLIHLGLPVREAYRVLGNYEVKQALEERFGPRVINDVLKPWLQRSSLQTVGPPPVTALEKTINFVSRSANMNTMFANVGNALQNVTGLFPAVREVGAGYVIRSLLRVAFGGKAAWREIVDRSTHLQNRVAKQVFETRGQIEQIAVGAGPLRKSFRWLNRNAYFLQTMTQNVIDVALHDAAYQKAMAADPTVDPERAHREAVATADSLVQLTQMAGDPEDVSTFEAEGPIWRALFPFKSWFINWGNLASTQFAADKRSGNIGDFVASYVYLLMLPAVLASTISLWARGRLPEDDEQDGWGDELFELFARSQLEQVLGTAPLFGDVALAAGRMLDDQVWNDRMPVPPFLAMFDRFLRTGSKIARNGAETGSVVDMLSLFGEMSGLPVRALGSRIRYVVDTNTGKVVPTGVDDYLRGLLTGAAGAPR